MDEVKALVGGELMHGGGTDAARFEMGLEFAPDFVASDAGSIDAGPAFLGSGKAMTHKQGIKQSMQVMIEGCLRKGIPLLMGSAGMGGAQGGAVHAGYLSIFNILPYRSGQPSGALL